MNWQKNMRVLISVVLIWAGLQAPVLADPTTWTDRQWSEQRRQFLRAHRALMAGNLERYRQLASGLKEYPLYYHLRYNYFKPKVHAVTAEEVGEFLENYQGAPLAEMLRRAWLKRLGKEENWEDFLRIYTPQSNTRLRCLAIRARIEQGDPPGAWIDKIKDLWLVGKSQPSACDPLFEHLYADPAMNDDLIWERMRYAIHGKKIGLASFLAKKIADPDRKRLANQWLAMHGKPATQLANLPGEDSVFLREIIVHGVKRLARKEPLAAWNWWQANRDKYPFSAPEKAATARFIALTAGNNDELAARPWLAAIPQNHVTDTVRLARLRLALRAMDWKELAQVIPTLTPEVRDSDQWQYWLARAEEQNGKKKAAQTRYAALAKNRSFYGFMAADREKLPHSLAEKPIVLAPGETAKLYRKSPGILRAREFYRLGFVGTARVEWKAALTELSSRERAVAAKLARSWCWFDRAILAAAGSDAMDDLDIRFPLAYRSQIEAASEENEISPTYAYATIRQESAFMTFVHSFAGAMGLMQLMPATAQGVGDAIGLEINGPEDTKSTYTNLRLGTAYLRQMLDKFNDRTVIASAAYNAGPGRAHRWLKERGCLPTDVWIELIPFTETRAYVKRVQEYASVYRQRLGLPARGLDTGPLPSRYCPTGEKS